MKEVQRDTLQIGDTFLNIEPVYLSTREMPIRSFDGFLSTIQFQQVAFDFDRQRFGWAMKGDRVHVASKPKDDSTLASALGRHLKKAKEAIDIPEPCGTSREKICSLQ